MDAKRLLIIILLLLIPSVCFSQHTSIDIIEDFSKMLQSHISPYILPKGAASQARNVRSNDTYGALSKRSPLRDYGTLGNYPITSLHRYYQSDGDKYLLGTGGEYILLGDDDGGTKTILRDSLTSGLRWTWVTYKDTAIGCNGTDNCQKYDGHSDVSGDGARTASLLTADLGAPYAELDTGTDLDASSWYQYKVAFYDGSTYYYNTTKSNPIKTEAAVYNIALTDIPLGPSGTTYRYIYRTLGGADRATVEADTTYYLVASINDNTTTTLADDETDNDADADNAPTWATVAAGTALTPPIGKFATLHKDRLFIANAPNLNSYFYWSYAFKPDIFSPSKYDYVRVDDGDAITGQMELLGKLVYLKTNSITNFETQNSDDTKWVFHTYSFTGCPAPYSPANSPLGIIYLGWDGIYVYTGENSQLISDVVTDQIRDILKSNLDEVSGSYFQNEYHLSYTSDESGESDNNTVLVLDTTRDSYVIDDKNVNCFTLFDSGTDYGTLYMGSSLDDGKVYAYSSALSNLIVRYKSDLDAGTKSSLSIGGTENNPFVELGWGVYINDASMSAVTLGSLTYATATVNRADTTGYWWSQAIQVDASDYDKLYWNEILGGSGDITLAIRSASTSAAATADGLAWSSELSDPSGSDVSGETANDYMQIRATLTTTDITQTPSLESVNNYVIRMIYSKVGSDGETAINSLHEQGWMNFEKPTIPKRIWGINVTYSGTSGTMSFNLQNERGDVNKTFTIDLSVDPDDDTDDQYFGDSVNKVYKWLPVANEEDDPTPIGKNWRYTITENGIVDWDVHKILTKFSDEEFYED